VGTASAARHGVWLLLFLAPIAGVPSGCRPGRPLARPALTARGTAAGLAFVMVVGVVLGLQLVRRQDAVQPVGTALVREVARLAGEGTVLAVEPTAETLAQQGVHVWVANPIDAFDSRTQGDFLDFLHDCRVPPADLSLVIVDERCAEAVVAQGWSLETTLDGHTVLVR
jgi:hypothetical protein